MGLKRHGYGEMPAVERTLASHLSPESASAIKAPALPTKPLRVTSSLVGKAYSAAGQAAACLHTMSVVQAYQADLLKELGNSQEIGVDVVNELRSTADLALRATKEAARCVGRSMASLVATERHLWLNLTEIKERDKSFLLNVPLSPDGLFGDAVSSVTERFQEARKQAAALQRFLPRKPQSSPVVERVQQVPGKSSSHRAHQKESVASRAPPHG
ncbi:MAG: hypothetical protein ACRCW3_02480, partial [Metamycoplasmataceae bacterium]